MSDEEQLPPGQVVTWKRPVPTYGETTRIDPAERRFRLLWKQEREGWSW